MYYDNLIAAQAYLCTEPAKITLELKRGGSTVTATESYLIAKPQMTVTGHDNDEFSVEFNSSNPIRFAVKANDIIENLVVTFFQQGHGEAQEYRSPIGTTANVNGIYHASGIKIEWL